MADSSKPNPNAFPTDLTRSTSPVSAITISRVVVPEIPAAFASLVNTGITFGVKSTGAVAPEMTASCAPAILGSSFFLSVSVNSKSPSSGAPSAGSWMERLSINATSSTSLSRRSNSIEGVYQNKRINICRTNESPIQDSYGYLSTKRLSLLLSLF